MAGLRVQINYIDYVMGPPGQLDWQKVPQTICAESGYTQLFKVPVMRVFGATSDGLSCCAHIHGAFQYFYVPYTGPDLRPCETEPFIADLFRRINLEMHTRRNRGEKLPDDCSFVANVVLCKAVPFYGYHVGWRYYLKIVVVDPSHTGKLVDLFRGGVFGKGLKPCESHLSYILQFFCDFNLHGCGWLDTCRYLVRQQECQSTAELEVDLQVENITNRLEIEERQLHNQYGEALSQNQADCKYIHSLKELWSSLQTTRDRSGLPHEYKSEYGERQTRDSRDQWFSAEAMFAELEAKVSGADRATSYDQFLPRRMYDNLVPTAFQAVKCMFKSQSEAPPKPKSASSSDQSSFSFGDSDSSLSLIASKHATSPPASTRKQKALDFAVSKPSFGHETGRFKDSQSSSQGSKTVTAVTYLEPPSREDCIASIDAHGLAQVVYPKPHYSQDKDVPKKAMTHGGVTFRLMGTSPRYLPTVMSEPPCRYILKGTVEYAPLPPSRENVQSWLEEDSAVLPTPDVLSSQIRQSTQRLRYLCPTQNTLSQSSDSSPLTVMSMEVHVNTRGDLNPDPDHDPVLYLCWSMEGGPNGIITNQETCPDLTNLTDYAITRAASEHEMVANLQAIVENWDPDILTGYEVQAASWGYLLERCRALGCPADFGRVSSRTLSSKIDTWGSRKASGVKVVGRHVLNLWRMIRSEVALLKYTLENVVFHVLHQRTPYYTHKNLTEMASGSLSDRTTLVRYTCTRTEYNLELLQTLEIVSRTAEQARVVGIDFSSVYTRGSQYKVESFLARLTKAENYMLASPSREQVGQQNALECIALVMEPESQLYTSPVLVLDFQSLYPSVVLAHNYCYSTCLGKVSDFEGANKLGTETLYYKPALIKRLLTQDDVTISPNGLVFVKPHIRKSLLARMLGEILETRFMVKDTAKLDRSNVSFQRLNHNRQLALKLVANVTYGYTSASFSGRMPCAEIADAIVQTGRETLERCIDVIHASSKWDAKVVYGDTDSLFVCLPGRTKQQAFVIGQQIADCITEQNPAPMKLQFEKVYLPCMLVAKKRYVGYKWEYFRQAEPVFDAKGIETVRRDGTPAAQKINEKALRLLFDTADLSLVKSYLYEQWTKILTGRVSIQDFCFAKEVKLGKYKEGGTLPAGAKLSADKMAVDMRFEPQYRERIPYVVVAGPPKSRLIDRCVSPETLLKNATTLSLDADYYINKTLIPPLDRFFNIVGASTLKWYEDMPKKRRFEFFQAAVSRATTSTTNQTTLKSYMSSSFCIVCKSRHTSSETSRLCVECENEPGNSTYVLQSDLRYREKRLQEIHTICGECSGDKSIRCESQDCPIYYSRVKALSKVDEASERADEWARQILLDDDLDW